MAVLAKLISDRKRETLGHSAERIKNSVFANCGSGRVIFDEDSIYADVAELSRSDAS